jgi:hypothetical protein
MNWDQSNYYVAPKKYVKAEVSFMQWDVFLAARTAIQEMLQPDLLKGTENQRNEQLGIYLLYLIMETGCRPSESPSLLNSFGSFNSSSKLPPYLSQRVLSTSEDHKSKTGLSRWIVHVPHDFDFERHELWKKEFSDQVAKQKISKFTNLITATLNKLKPTIFPDGTSPKSFRQIRGSEFILRKQLA